MVEDEDGEGSLFLRQDFKTGGGFEGLEVLICRMCIAGVVRSLVAMKRMISSSGSLLGKGTL